MPFVELNLKEINNEMLELAATEGLLFVEQAKAVVVEGEIKEVKKEADESLYSLNGGNNCRLVPSRGWH